MDGRYNEVGKEELGRLRGSLASVNSDMRLNSADQKLINNIVEK